MGSVPTTVTMSTPLLLLSLLLLDSYTTATCPPLPTDNCAMVFDSHDCSGGWNLTVSDGDSFSFDGLIFSSTWWFRNDIDTVGVKSGCNLTMWTEEDYSGLVNSWSVPDRWLVLEHDPQYTYLHENIESLRCRCTDSPSARLQGDTGRD